MAPLVGPHDEKYEDFYSSWVNTQEELLKNLQEALDSDMREPELFQEVKKVAEHYENYYDAKQSASHQDVLQTVTASWRSPLEKAFLWLGGWRPSLAFQLVYALAGQQIEAELADFLEGVDTPTFASLTPLQLSQVSELQTATNKLEENLSNDMAMLQQSFADQPLLTLAQVHHMVQSQEGSAHEDDDNDGDSSNGADESDRGSDGDEQDSMGSAMQDKLKSLQEIALQADSLRLTTLQKVLDILNTYQKAQYLISAGKLQVALRNLGEKLNGTKLS